MCTEVKVKASEIKENSGWEEALGMDIDLRKRKLEKKLVKFSQKEEEPRKHGDMIVFQ